MKILANCLTALLATALVAACATTQPQESGAVTNRPDSVAAQGKALVVVCRASALKGVAWDHDYYIDGKLVARLSSGGFTHVNVPPQELVIAAGPKKNPTFRTVNIKAELGGVYYLIDDPGNTFASYESFKITTAETCANRSKRYQNPIVTSAG